MTNPPVVPMPAPAPSAVALLRWGIQHYRVLLVRRARGPVSFPMARRLFARNVLFRDDRTLRRWLGGLTPIPPEVERGLVLRRQTAAALDKLVLPVEPTARRRAQRRIARGIRNGLTLREILWGVVPDGSRGGLDDAA